MFKSKTYAKVVDQAFIVERNCNCLSKDNDQEREPNQVIFLGESLVKVYSRSKGCLIHIRRHIWLIQDVEWLIMEYIIWSQALKSEPMAKPNDVNRSQPKIQWRVFAITGQDDEESKLGTISLFSFIKWNNCCQFYVTIVWLW